MAIFPFAAITGIPQTREALLLLAVDPGLKGVLVLGGPGTAKTLLARAFQSLIPERFVEAPLGVTEDRLLGGLDLERTLLTGERRAAQGLLQQAHGGVLYVDEVNLLDERSQRHIAGALKSGMVRIEREGFSGTGAADFALIGTCDPAEGEVAAALAEAVGIQVTEAGSPSGRVRAEIVERVLAFERHPAAFAERYAVAMNLLRRRIAEARRRLPGVSVTMEDRRRLSLTALHLGVAGHRADVFAAHLARARAAFLGRDAVEGDDLDAAVRLVLLPRAAVSEPQDAEGDAPREGEHSADGNRPASVPMEDLVIQSTEGSVPAGLLDPPPGKGAGGRGKGRSGKESWRRGRYVRAVGRKPEGGRVALEATLRAAAPFQVRRAASPGICVVPTDLRYKQFRQKAGLLIVFVVDASGSMAVNRMAQAKGVLIRLLQEAYLHRDRVALIGFRGSKAEVLLEPGRSVELARRRLDGLPVGGATPLAAGLHAALGLAQRSQYGDVRQKLLVLLTDGRANAAYGAGAGIWQEIESVCAAIRVEGLSSVVIDTTQAFLSTGQAARLAEMMGGRCVALPRPGAEALYGVVAAEAESARRGRL